MALNADDARPIGIDLGSAYSAIRKWYQANMQLVEARSDEYARGSAALIRALPPSDELSTLEFRAVFAEVISGYLEWGYHRSDEHFKMGAYAHAALDAAGLSHNLSEPERVQLGTSRLWPFLFFNRGRPVSGGGSPGGPLLASTCPAPDCPLRSSPFAAPGGGLPVLLHLMFVGGGRKPPRDQFLDLVRRVHKGTSAREEILTDPYIYSDAGEGGTRGGYENLIEYLHALNLAKTSEFTLSVNPSPRNASEAAKLGFKRTVTDAFPNAKIATFSSASRFHDRFYLVRDAGGSLSGIFGPSLNGLDSDSVVLMGELEPMGAMDRLRALFN
jgi:hypothetical protein